MHPRTQNTYHLFPFPTPTTTSLPPLFQANAVPPSPWARNAMTKKLKRVRPGLTLPYHICTARVCVCVCLFVCIQQDVDSFPMHPLLIIPWRVPADDKCDAKAVCKGVDKCSGKLCKAKSQCHAPGKCVFKTGLCSNPFAPKTLKCDDKNDKTGVNLCLDPFFFQPCRCSRCFFMISYGFFVFFVTDHL